MGRPEILFPLFADTTSLPGVGPKIAALLAKSAGPRVVDLLFTPPTGIVDRRFSPGAAAAPAGRIASFVVTILKHEAPRTPRRPHRVLCEDATGPLALIYFHAHGDWLTKTYPVGERRIVSGRVDRFDGAAQIAHPDIVAREDEADAVLRAEPVYPLTTGLGARLAAKAAAAAVAAAPDLPDWLDPALKAREGWPDWRDALDALHAPQGAVDLGFDAAPRRRLAYDELLASQLALAIVRARRRANPGRETIGDGAKRAAALAALPFAPTAAQSRAVDEILADMAAPRRMLRLLQGDVGSGKTLVAALAMLAAAEAGAQAAMMAPTEVLARQHFAGLKPLAEAAGVEIALLTGRDRGKGRAATLDGLASGRIALAVGTHALLTGDVAFADLALAVIDEQHRFGVHQRLTLSAKAQPDRPPADILVATATPIPRTLLLIGYGDIDVSRLDEKPPGRRPIVTRAVPEERTADVVAAVGRALDRGEKIYWICPTIDGAEEEDRAAAEARRNALAAVFPGRVGLAHGRLKPAEKDRAMAAFSGADASGGAIPPGEQTDVLVATTVVEVGVDVPSATLIVIEGAERFGLAQLHQLRGRVGRGDRDSLCLLVYAGTLSPTSQVRLKAIRDSEDGFQIAEQDLRLRGGGDVLGPKQSGLPAFRIADAATHHDLLLTARDDARLIVERDPTLISDRGRALRLLLHVQDSQDAVRTLESG